ncbi:hypothetical protein CALVIDRAFT_144321 [Calocera viscosa TUFC12733]|uniref:Pre-SET domain-containing protein n=1 Tax=Calocera viscosa (strain TUFC12733) TaxID=1330018 RepID=A0A167LRU8_CALVF|nr:hypothetical protein CALVIDRAFT_144321 [Calocera viscosa TUFC12733]
MDPSSEGRKRKRPTEGGSGRHPPHVASAANGAGPSRPNRPPREEEAEIQFMGARRGEPQRTKVKRKGMPETKRDVIDLSKSSDEESAPTPARKRPRVSNPRAYREASVIILSGDEPEPVPGPSKPRARAQQTSRRSSSPIVVIQGGSSTASSSARPVVANDTPSSLPTPPPTSLTFPRALPLHSESPVFPSASPPSHRSATRRQSVGPVSDLPRLLFPTASPSRTPFGQLLPPSTNSHATVSRTTGTHEAIADLLLSDNDDVLGDSDAGNASEPVPEETATALGLVVARTGTSVVLSDSQNPPQEGAAEDVTVLGLVVARTGTSALPGSQNLPPEDLGTVPVIGLVGSGSLTSHLSDSQDPPPTEIDTGSSFSEVVATRARTSVLPFFQGNALKDFLDDAISRRLVAADDLPDSQDGMSEEQADDLPATPIDAPIADLETDGESLGEEDDEDEEEEQEYDEDLEEQEEGVEEADELVDEKDPAEDEEVDELDDDDGDEPHLTPPIGSFAVDDTSTSPEAATAEPVLSHHTASEERQVSIRPKHSSAVSSTIGQELTETQNVTHAPVIAVDNLARQGLAMTWFVEYLMRQPVSRETGEEHLQDGTDDVISSDPRHESVRPSPSQSPEPSSDGSNPDSMLGDLETETPADVDSPDTSPDQKIDERDENDEMLPADTSPLSSVPPEYESDYVIELSGDEEEGGSPESGYKSEAGSDNESERDTSPAVTAPVPLDFAQDSPTHSVTRDPNSPSSARNSTEYQVVSPVTPSGIRIPTFSRAAPFNGYPTTESPSRPQILRKSIGKRKRGSATAISVAMPPVYNGQLPQPTSRSQSPGELEQSPAEHFKNPFTLWRTELMRASVVPAERNQPPIANEICLASELGQPLLQDAMNGLPNTPFLRFVFTSVFEAHIQESAGLDELDAPPIKIINTVDDKPCPDPTFVYTNKIIYGEGIPPPDLDALEGCDCEGPCDPNSTTCSCIHRQGLYPDNDVDYGFVHDSKGCLRSEVEPAVIVECNSACRCSVDCQNRVIQKGRTASILIKKTKTKGWGMLAELFECFGSDHTLYYRRVYRKGNPEPHIHRCLRRRTPNGPTSR